MFDRQLLVFGEEIGWGGFLTQTFYRARGFARAGIAIGINRASGTFH